MTKGPAIVDRASSFLERLAIVDETGEHTYGELLEASGRVAAGLLEWRDDLDGARVCFHIPPGFVHVAVLWGIWRAGAIAVPLAMSHPVPELEYTIGDADPEIIIATGPGEEVCRAIAERRGDRFIEASE